MTPRQQAATLRRLQESENEAAAAGRRPARKIVMVPNPAEPGGLQPAALITDRAKRYRAAAANEQPDELCIYCGATPADGQIVTDHIDGNEAHANPQNLAYACKACNTSKGALFARLGLGRRTRQYNPEGATTTAQWFTAVMAITPRVRGKHEPGSSDMDPLQAVELIRATPPERRQKFAAELAKRKGRQRR